MEEPPLPYRYSTPPPPPPARTSGYLGNTDEFNTLSSPAGSNSTSYTKLGCYCWDSGAMFNVGERGGGEGEGEGDEGGREGEEEKCSYDAAEEDFYYPWPDGYTTIVDGGVEFYLLTGGLFVCLTLALHPIGGMEGEKGYCINKLEIVICLPLRHNRGSDLLRNDLLSYSPRRGRFDTGRHIKPLPSDPHKVPTLP